VDNRIRPRKWIMQAAIASAAVRAITSHGIPRTINILCDTAFVYEFAAGADNIIAEFVRDGRAEGCKNTCRLISVNNYTVSSPLFDLKCNGLVSLRLNNVSDRH
jgi:hypothetical protein